MLHMTGNFSFLALIQDNSFHPSNFTQFQANNKQRYDANTAKIIFFQKNTKRFRRPGIINEKNRSGTKTEKTEEYTYVYRGAEIAIFPSSSVYVEDAASCTRRFPIVAGFQKAGECRIFPSPKANMLGESTEFL